IILNPAQPISTAPFTVEIGNQGSAPAVVFLTSITLADGTSFSAPTTVILNPSTKTTVTINVNFTKPGPQFLTITLDTTNVVPEYDNLNNVLVKSDINVLVATAPGPTNTPSYTPSPLPTFTPTVPTVAPTLTNTELPSATFTASATNTQVPGVTPPTATPTFTPTSTFTPTPTFTATPIPPTATHTLTPPPGVTLPTATPCPQATAEPLSVDPVQSPTTGLTQVIVVHIGNGAKVSVVSESGTFEVTGDFSVANPAQVQINLLPNTTHHLSVTATVKTMNVGGCNYGVYTLNTAVDNTGKPLSIVQHPATAPATNPVPAAPTLTPS